MLSFLDKLFRRAPAPLEAKAALRVSGTSALRVSGTSAPEAWFVEALGGRLTASNVQVNPVTAMTAPPVKRAVDLIGSTVGNLPVRLFRLSADEERTPAPDHPAAGLVAHAANPWTSARKFRETLTRDALLTGDGFAEVVRVGGRPIELHHLPGTVTVEFDALTREPFYRVTLDGGVRLLSWRDVLHLAAPSLDGVSGASPVDLGREAIGLALTLERHAALMFGNGARPGGVITVTGALGDTGGPRLKRSWDAAFGGEGTGGTAVLENGATFAPITLTSVDAEHMAQRRHQVREIANVFGLPSTLLNDAEAATYKNAEALGQAFRDETILPWVCAWEDAYARALLTEEERATHLVAFDLDALDRADLNAKAEAMAKRRAAGLVTANEERRALNLPPVLPEGAVLGSPYTTPGAPAGSKPAEEAPADE